MDFTGQLNEIGKRMANIERGLEFDVAKANKRADAAYRLRDRVCDALAIQRYSTDDQIIEAIARLSTEEVS